MIQLAYVNNPDVLTGLPTILGRYQVKPSAPKEEDYSLTYKVKLDLNGVCKLDSVELVENYNEEKKIPVKSDTPKAAAPAEEKKDEATPADSAEAKPAADAPAEAPKQPEQQYETKIVKKTRTTPVDFTFETHGLSKD